MTLGAEQEVEVPLKAVSSLSQSSSIMFGLLCSPSHIKVFWKEVGMKS